jgi:hypothetical protein
MRVEVAFQVARAEEAEGQIAEGAGVHRFDIGMRSGSRIQTGVSAASTSALSASMTLEKILNIAFSLRLVIIVDD